MDVEGVVNILDDMGSLHLYQLHGVVLDADVEGGPHGRRCTPYTCRSCPPPWYRAGAGAWTRRNVGRGCGGRQGDLGSAAVKLVAQGLVVLSVPVPDEHVVVVSGGVGMGQG